MVLKIKDYANQVDHDNKSLQKEDKNRCFGWQTINLSFWTHN